MTTTEVHRPVRFILDGEIHEVADPDSNRSVLQYLREDLQRTGSKEGCAEGDCGACTVVVGELDGDAVRYRAVNACIQFLPTLDGKALFTVESLSGPGEALHPVQQAMLECHGSQCGFCTPGFVMSLFALYKSGPWPGRRGVDDALAGNLCRCTGYRPIVDAAARMYELGADGGERQPSLLTAPAGRATPGEEVLKEQLRGLSDRRTLRLSEPDRMYHAPTSLDALAALAAEHPDATLLAGGTDVGLWVTKQQWELPEMLYTGQVAELQRIDVTDDHLEIGAAVTLADAFPVILEQYPEFEELFMRFASPPIRNTGTLGGNIANGSPIGDTMPALIAVGAEIVLASAGNDGVLRRRELALEDFYTDYQENARRPGEVLATIRVPLRRENTRVGAYKISKRFDQDISAVCAAFALRLEDGRVDGFRAGFGGVAAIPKRAAACEQVLIGGSWNEAVVKAAMDALDEDFTPLTDMRASEDYRRRVMKNLLYRFHLTTTAGADSERVEPLYGYGR
ncbi:MAG: xanthine dehydrogenase small subunit [Gammaproteobacteria bacterium]|nr:xanthine dehydrogenase small subunit [Gammaproteobacteria bacterium]